MNLRDWNCRYHQAMEPKIDVNTVKGRDKGCSEQCPLSLEGIGASVVFRYMSPNNSLPPKPVFGWHFCYLQPRSSLIQKIRWLVKAWVTRQPQSRPAVLGTSFQQPEQHCLWTKLDPAWVCACSHVSLFASPWTVAHQAPLFLEFSRQEYWSRLPSPTRQDLSHARLEPEVLVTLALAGRFFTAGLATREALIPGWGQSAI